jgi:hypothetical protein
VTLAAAAVAVDFAELGPAVAKNAPTSAMHMTLATANLVLIRMLSLPLR